MLPTSNVTSTLTTVTTTTSGLSITPGVPLAGDPPGTSPNVINVVHNAAVTTADSIGATPAAADPPTAAPIPLITTAHEQISLAPVSHGQFAAADNPPGGSGSRPDLPPLKEFCDNLLRDFYDLTPSEQVLLLESKGLNAHGTASQMADRLIRFSLRYYYGETTARWDPCVDPLQDIPVTYTAFLAYSAANNAELQDRSHLEHPPSPVTRYPHGTFAADLAASLTASLPPVSQVRQHTHSLPLPPSPPQQPLLTIRPAPRGNSTYRLDRIGGTVQSHGTVPTPGVTIVSHNIPVYSAAPGGAQPQALPAAALYPAPPATTHYRVPQTAQHYQPPPAATHHPPPPAAVYSIAPAATYYQGPNTTHMQWATPAAQPTLPPEQYTIQPSYNTMQYPNNSNRHRAITAFRHEDFVFSGAVGEDPLTFLDRLEDCVRQYHLTDEDILLALPSAFKDHAATWYRTNSGLFTSYAQFLEVFYKTFCPRTRVEAFWQEIHRRTQGEGEPIRDYLICLQALFAKIYPPAALERQLDIAYSQLHPTYLDHIQRRQISSYADLMEAGLDVEQALQNKQGYRPPPTPTESLAPNFACLVPTPPKPSDPAVHGFSPRLRPRSPGHGRLHHLHRWS